MCQLVLVLPHSMHNVLSLPNNKLDWCCLGNALASLLEFGIGLDNSSLGFFIEHHSCVSTWHYITLLHVMRSLGLPLYNCTLKVTEFITGGCEGLWMRLQYIGVFSPHCLTSHRVSYNCIVMCNKTSWYLSLIYIGVISPTVAEQHEISVGVQQQVETQPETGKLFIMHVSCTQANVFAVMHCRNTKFIVLHDLDVQWYPRFIDVAIHKEIFCHHFSSVLAACV